jgi:hypothetical protein
MELISCHEISVNRYKHTLHNNPEEREHTLGAPANVERIVMNRAEVCYPAGLQVGANG